MPQFVLLNLFLHCSFLDFNDNYFNSLMSYTKTCLLNQRSYVKRTFLMICCSSSMFFLHDSGQAGLRNEQTSCWSSKHMDVISSLTSFR